MVLNFLEVLQRNEWGLLRKKNSHYFLYIANHGGIVKNLFSIWAGAGSNLHCISGYSVRLYVPPLSHSREIVVRRSKVKGKGRLWVLHQCCLEAYCTLTRMSSFIHLHRRCTHQAA